MITLILTAFAVSFFAAAIPGPAIAWVTAISATEGRRAGMACVLGIAIGTGMILIASIFLIDEIDFSKSLERPFLRWLGAGLMILLAIGLLLSSETSSQATNTPGNRAIGGALISIVSPAHIFVVLALISEASVKGAVTPVSLAIVLGDTLPMIGAVFGAKIIPFSPKTTTRLAAAAMFAFAGTTAAGVM